MEEKKTLLLTVCELGRLGDIVASEPIYRYLKGAYPGRKLRWYTKPDYAELLKYSPAVDEVVQVNSAEEYFALKKKFPPGTISCELNFRDPSRSRVRSSGRRGPAGFASLMEQFASAAGLSVPDETPQFHFRPGLKADDLPERYAVFHCCSNSRSRQWPRKHWLALARMFLDAGWHLAEVGIYPFLRLNHSHFIDRTGKQDLQYVAKLIDRARLLVGVESGFGHIANATGTFAVIITGKLHNCPDYIPYSGRFRRGEGENPVRFYDVPSEELPLEIAQEIIRRYLAGKPMSFDECRCFCLTEQVKRLHRAWSHRLKEWLRRPFRRLSRTLTFHKFRHG